MKKDNWPKAYAGPRLPTLPYTAALLLYLFFDSSLSTTPKK